ncbi:ectonucleoside triphosphate diphosphohydrolase 8 isoform X2 [Sceloporus undulatus]|nr:ectonucleoside triphosphate diphosphohydrolase 8 isoform X2 [Sceloporus undulatus]
MGFKWNEWFLRAALLVLVIFSLIALILSLVGIHNVSLPPGNKYGLVFDAGSSHTSLFVYQWPTDKENNTGVVSQTFSCYVNGSGISSYASNPPEAGASLRECLNEAMAVIPSERQRETPAYLGATAGMRLLRIQNASASQQVLEEVGKTIQQYPVSFQGARIITGEDEGAYGWITINYLLNSFTQYSAKDQDWIHPTSANILGALDLGGASTQISFAPAGHITDPAEAIQFRLYGFDYTIYTHSYLCYGQNEALTQVIRIIVNSSTSTEVNHPCYPKGYNSSVTTPPLFNSPCAKQWGVPMVRKNVTLVGTGNATLCRETIKKIFNFSHCSHNQSCSFNGVYQPKVNGKFLAFSAYYYTFSFLNLTETHPLATVEAAIQAFCARKWDELKASYPKQRTDRLRNYCASANYILTLLLDGYGFSNTTWENIAFRMQAANSDIGWTLGYMLNLTNMIPSEAPQLLRGHEEGTWVASIFFIVATLALSLILLVIYFLR